MATLIALPMGSGSVPGLASGEGERDKESHADHLGGGQDGAADFPQSGQTSFGEGDHIVFQHVCSDRRVANRSPPHHCLWSRLQTRLSSANK